MIEQVPSVEAVREAHTDPAVESEPMTLESSREVGDWYKEYLDTLLHPREDDKERILVENSLAPKLEQLRRSSSKFFEQQARFVDEHPMDARDILAQAFRSPEQSRALEDASKYRLEEMRPGLYVIHLDPEVARVLRPGSDAVAVQVRGGLSFIVMPDHQDAEDERRQLEENIPHETHHLVWGTATNAFESNETDPHSRAAFKEYQDELIARLVSGGRLAGYHHLNHLSPEALQQLKEETPGKMEEIIHRVGEMNGWLRGFEAVLHRSEEITSKDIVGAVMEATTFDELETNLQRMKTIMEQKPLRAETQDVVGWG